jgi:3-deoxy-D-manno-octulosonic-acid transferase
LQSRSPHGERRGATSQATSKGPGLGPRSGLLTAYQVLTSGVYAILRLGYDIIPPLRPRLAPRLALDLGAGPARPLVHFHASSVGEISSIAPVVREAAKALPDHAFLVTTMTATGRRRAAEVLPEAEVRLLPFDFKPAMQRFVKTLNPAIMIIAETELWPNLLREARRRDTPLVLVNGRISTGSIRHYLRLRPLVRSMLSQFDLLLMRSDEDADRVKMLGADPDRVVVTGNTKYDVLPGPVEEAERRALKRRLGLGEGRPVIILGSAREGETEILLRGLGDLDSAAVPAVIIAPRHLENVPRLEAALGRAGYTARLSADAREEGPAGLLGDREAIIVNEMGRLLEYYAVSDVAVLGGTFTPHGGHNPLEPASQGAVVVVGPYRDNIADDIHYLMGENGVIITDGAGLGGALRDLIEDPARMEATARGAACAVQARKGAAVRCVEAMKSRGLLS